MFKAIISIDDEDLMEILRNENDKEMDRSSLKYHNDNIEVKANDIVAFKATVNGIIKLIETYENTKKSIQ